MELKTFTVAELRTALLSEDFWLSKTLPITKQRAVSFCRNPRAEADDPVLLVAYKGRQVLGYLGILPDRIFVNDAGRRLGWLTGWWVDPSAAASGVGVGLLFKALNLYGGHIGVAGGSKEARKVINASQKFFEFKPLKGIDIKLRMKTEKSIGREIPWTKVFRVGFRVADVVLDEVLNLRYLSWERRNRVRRRLGFEYLASVDAEAGRFIERQNHRDLTRKGKAELDWIMTCPWIVSAPEKDAAGRRYFFSSVAERFFHLGVKVFDPKNEMVGFLMLRVRNDRMSVSYAHFEDRHAPEMAAAAVHHALAMDAAGLSLYDERLVKSLSNLGCPCWSTRSVSRGFFLPKSLAGDLRAECRLHGGDGDFAFY
jgi:hypothetical protein